MDSFVGIFRTLLPVRYWDEIRAGSYLSILLTAALGARLGLAGFFDQGGGVGALAFFLFTPLGWLADYLVISAVYRGLTLAADNPQGDPILTVIDNLIRGKTAADLTRKEAADRELAEGPEVADQILECRTFAGKDADFVVIASRRKEGWTLATTVSADTVRLRLGDPLEKTVEGRLRTCYPLSVIRDIQVDRRIVHYEWPPDAPPLPDLAGEPEE